MFLSVPIRLICVRDLHGSRYAVAASGEPPLEQLEIQFRDDRGGRAGGRCKPWRYALWIASGALIPLLGASVPLLVSQEEPVHVAASPARVEDIHFMPQNTAAAPLPVPESGPAPNGREEMTVARGDTLERMFRQRGLSIGDLGSLSRLEEAAPHLRLLNPGDLVVVTHDAGHVHSLERTIDHSRMLRIERNEDGFDVNIVDRKLQRRTAVARGVIRDSLFGAAQAAGLADAVTLQMAEIFRWDIDFVNGVRPGDEFRVVYQQLWNADERIGDGAILAAEFVNRGRSYRVARHARGGDAPDYFTPDGRSVQKAFLRAPVEFTRVSSVYGSNRRHPVLNTIRAHRGVDYAAPEGTPVRAAGDGTVVFAGGRNGYGSTVILEHGRDVTTLYAHLSRFADIVVGDRVMQGETIGYVGMTGLATGPHLHYEYRVNNEHRDPQNAIFDDSDAMPYKEFRMFEDTVTPLWALLDLLDSSELSARVLSSPPSVN